MEDNSVNVSKEHSSGQAVESPQPPQQGAQPTERPWHIVTEAPHLIFGPLRRAVATVNPAGFPRPLLGYVHEQTMMSDEEYKQSEQEGWGEQKQKEIEANAELIVRAVNAHEALVDALFVLGWRSPNGKDVCWCHSKSDVNHTPQCKDAQAAYRLATKPDNGAESRG